MAWQRTIPFGYQMTGGEIICHPQEAEAVVLIFRLYKDGESYQAIAEAMSKLGIVYHAHSPVWNKHMVKRILENEKYLGKPPYPAIVSHAEYYAAQSKQAQKTENWRSASRCVELVKSRAVCGECGKPMRKLTSARDGIRWWHCSDTGCDSMIKLRDTDLEAVISELMTGITSTQAPAPQDTVAAINIEATRLHNEINRELNKTDFNEDYTRTLIFALAAERYAHCEDVTEQTRRQSVMERLHSQAATEGFDHALFDMAVSAVVMVKGGGITLRLIDGREIRKEAR